jgi:hypothetical protein
MVDPQVFTHGVVPGLAGLARDISAGFDRRAALEAGRREEEELEEERRAAQEAARAEELRESLEGTVEAAREVPARKVPVKTRANPQFAEQMAAAEEGERATDPVAFVQDIPLSPEAQQIADMDSDVGSQEAKDSAVSLAWQMSRDEDPRISEPVKDLLNAYHTSRFDFGEKDFMSAMAKVAQAERWQRAEAAGAGPQAIAQRTQELVEANGGTPEQAAAAAQAQIQKAFPGYDPDIGSVSDLVTEALSEAYERMPAEQTADAQIEAEFRRVHDLGPDEPIPPGVPRSTPGEREALTRAMPNADRVERDQALATAVVAGESMLDIIARDKGNGARIDGYRRNLAAAGLDSGPVEAMRLVEGRPSELETREADIVSALRMAVPGMDSATQFQLATADPAGPGYWRTFYGLPPQQQATVSRVFEAFGRGVGPAKAHKETREEVQEALRRQQMEGASSAREFQQAQRARNQEFEEARSARVEARGGVDYVAPQAPPSAGANPLVEWARSRLERGNADD